MGGYERERERERKKGILSRRACARVLLESRPKSRTKPPVDGSHAPYYIQGGDLSSPTFKFGARNFGETGPSFSCFLTVASPSGVHFSIITSYYSIQTIFFFGVRLAFKRLHVTTATVAASFLPVSLFSSFFFFPSSCLFLSCFSLGRRIKIYAHKKHVLVLYPMLLS